MIRWVLIFVVLANAVLFYWLQQVSASSQGGELTEATSFNVDFDELQSLVLLSEKPKPVVAAVPAVSRYEDQFNQSLNGAGDNQLLDAPAVAAGESAMELAGASDEQAVSPGERSQGVAAAQAVEGEVVVAEAASAAVDEVPALCAWVGEFSDLVSAKQVAYRMQALDISVEPRTREVEIAPLYWVYIPSLGSRKAALAMLRDLQSRRIDSFIVTEGEHKHAISLGYFSKRSSVEKAKLPHAKQAYRVEVERKARFEQEFWLFAQAEQAQRISEALLLRIAEDYADIKKIEKPCEIVAL